MVSHHPKDGHHHPKDGHPPAKIYKKELYCRLEILHLDFTHKIKTRWPGDNCHGWSTTIPRMVTNHSKDGHQPSKIYHKEVYYRLWIWHIDLTHKIKTRWSVMDGQPPSPGWSATIQRMVTHHPMDGHPPSKIYQKEVCYRLEIWHKDLTQNIKTRWQLPGMVSHHYQQTLGTQGPTPIQSKPWSINGLYMAL